MSGNARETLMGTAVLKDALAALPNEAAVSGAAACEVAPACNNLHGGGCSKLKTRLRGRTW